MRFICANLCLGGVAKLSFSHRVRRLGNLVAVVCFVHIYGRSTCPYCILAERFLSSCGVKYIFHDIHEGKNQERAMMLLESEGKPFKTVPQIFVCDEHIGGYGDMVRMSKDKSLQEIFKSRKIKYKCE